MHTLPHGLLRTWLGRRRKAHVLKCFLVCVEQSGTCHLELILSLYYFASEIKGSFVFSSFLVPCIFCPGPLAKMLFSLGPCVFQILHSYHSWSYLRGNEEEKEIQKTAKILRSLYLFSGLQGFFSWFLWREKWAVLGLSDSHWLTSWYFPLTSFIFRAGPRRKGQEGNRIGICPHTLYVFPLCTLWPKR